MSLHEEALANHDEETLRHIQSPGCMHQIFRRLTLITCSFEYSLVAGVNDSDEDAKRELEHSRIHDGRNYFQETGRRITFEYSLVAGVNDSDEDARELSSRIHDINCHVNLIPVNPIKERSYRRSTHQAVENFKIKLEKCGINVTIRREMGSDIDGACGQLRKSYMEKSYDPQ